MPFLREAGTEATGTAISDAAVKFLRAHLETMTTEATAFYIDAPTIEILAEDHAPSLLINRLREVLNKRDCADVELVGAAPPTEDEIAGVIERREQAAREEEAVQAVKAEEAAGAAAQSAELDDAPAVEQATAIAEPAEDTEPAEPAVSSPEEEVAQPIVIAGRALQCVVCSGAEFLERRAQIQTSIASSAGEWRVSPANCYICGECGYVHWFMP